MGEEDSGYQSVRVDCTCGRELQTAESDDRLHCECGRIFALTITGLAGPTDDEEPPTDDE